MRPNILPISDSDMTLAHSEPSPNAVTKVCIDAFLEAPSESAELLSIIVGQTKGGAEITITTTELDREQASRIADSKNFDAMQQAAQDRGNIRLACERARRFFAEHLIQRNPFPPRIRLARQPRKRVHHKIAATPSCSTSHINSPLPLARSTVSSTSLRRANLSASENFKSRGSSSSSSTSSSSSSAGAGAPVPPPNTPASPMVTTPMLSPRPQDSRRNHDRFINTLRTHE